MAAITLNTNLAALNGQRRLGESTARLDRTFERLSSGLRINRASDDAAGLSIAAGLNVDARVFSQGIRNINDGASYLNVAEGALGEMTGVLLRLKEIAQQSANGVLGNPQRLALQGEVDALSNEYNRSIEATKFNDRQVFSALEAELRVQGGYGENGSITVRLGSDSTGGSGDSGAITEIARVSVDSGSTQANDISFSPSISADGRYVAFISSATNLVAGDTNSRDDIFVYDTQTGDTMRINVDSGGTQANGSSVDYPSLSADGRYVAFQSAATNLVAGDTNARSDVFLRDIQTGTTTRISVSSGGVQGNNTSASPSISVDGRYVIFQSDSSNLVAGDTNGATDIFAHDTQTGITTRVSINSGSTQGNSSSYEPSISADGRYVAFYSLASNLVAGDTNGATDVFVRDTQTGTTTRVSTDSSGTQGNSNSYDPSISADGRYVAFHSNASNLVVGDTNGANDVFVHDTQTGTTTRLSVDSSSTQGNNGSYEPSISAEGRYVVFSSDASNLVAGDTNGSSDIFAITNPLASSSGSSSFSSIITPLNSLLVTTQAESLVTLNALNTSLAEVAEVRGRIGAGMSRFTTAVATLGVGVENLAAAESRIVDADVAEESAGLVKTRILQQVGAAVLGQANQLPALSLRLLAA